ncbi:hypothetical protein GOODEAATRI_026505 [Goodea atripinnis]|uniref:Uncharacterized protein n=1 Tax=Goodea atripinnis TaxID=208336 RepID=A0ABV0PRW0_9TELE
MRRASMSEFSQLDWRCPRFLLPVTLQTVAENAPLQPHETWLCLSDALDSVEYRWTAALSPVAPLNQELVPRRNLRSRNGPGACCQSHGDQLLRNLSSMSLDLPI